MSKSSGRVLAAMTAGLAVSALGFAGAGPTGAAAHPSAGPGTRL